MLKFLFLDNWGYEAVDGFERELQRAVKAPQNPLFVAEHPWEQGNITMYGSALRAPDGRYQMWYTVIEPRWHLLLAYAESDDGITWRKPELDIYLHEGHKTNIVFAQDPHGAAVLYDEADPRPDWKYKLVCGTEPTTLIHAFHSADGIHWLPVSPEPIVRNHPDCPMALLRRPDGTYAAHHRVPKGGRRIGRSESPDFIHWQGGRIVMEPGPGDPPQFQMYGMGSAMYGDLELGTLWDYRTDLGDPGRGKMNGYQETELSYSRNGLSWHRPAQGQPFIPHGGPGEWDSGNLQCASAPVFLPDEIRYYYAASTVRHSSRWELKPARYGVGLARMRPDRFVALVAGDVPATVYTRASTVQAPEIRINAEVASGGQVQMELLDADCKVIPGFELSACVPITGESLGHVVSWRGAPDAGQIINRPIRWRLQATHAKVYSIWMPNGDTQPRYDRFQSAF